MADALCPPFSSWPGVYQAFLSDGLRQASEVTFACGSEQHRPADDRFVCACDLDIWRYGHVDGTGAYRFHHRDGSSYLWAVPGPEYGRVDIWTHAEAGRRPVPLRYPVDKVLFMGVLAHRSGCIVHSCGWNCQGHAIVFPGVSGAGKSTLSRQLMAAGAGAVLSDDRMVLRNGPDGFRAWGTPWPGDALQARNESAPLAALCFIEKSPVNYVRPIQPADALRRLAATTSIPWYLPELRDRVLPLLEQLVFAVPVFRLGFRPEPDVVDCLLPLLEDAGRRPT
ncbi:MAG: hypothetical protein KBC66_08595 [Kiritimatiellae bacterium]|nr:hypothetical protein [Kiritimatiellia bacterium]NLD88762.1 hypothetical protein [Lentisphaerota bacterium]HPC18997.1 hypothetical protein [Kiritimatiellia bacterium]HQQ59863.1 hypothetical protein [Kiritimatiellia bacterium]